MKRHIPEGSKRIIPILARFKDQASLVYGENLHKVILYGSYARGNANQNSDIDLMIVLSEMGSAFDEIERLNDIKFGIDLDFDIYISTNPVSKDSYSHSNIPIFKNIALEGIEI